MRVPLVLWIAALAACSNAHSYDCNEACNIYQDCFQPLGFDAKGCENNCESHAGSDDAYGAMANACHDCLSDHSCATADAGADFSACAAMCTGVVPFVPQDAAPRD